MSVKLTPWIDGFYYNKNFSPELLKVQGNEVDFYNILYLDFPDIEPRAVGYWTFGDFGPARQDIIEASGGHAKVSTYKMQNIKFVQCSNFAAQFNII